MENTVLPEQDRVEKKYVILSYLAIIFLIVMTFFIFAFSDFFVEPSPNGTDISSYFLEILYFSTPVFIVVIGIFIRNRKKTHKKTVLFALIASTLHLAGAIFFYNKNLKEEEIVRIKSQELYEAQKAGFDKCIKDIESKYQNSEKKPNIKEYFECQPPINGSGRPFRSRKFFGGSKEAEVVKGGKWSTIKK